MQDHYAKKTVIFLYISNGQYEKLKYFIYNSTPNNKIHRDKSNQKKVQDTCTLKTSKHY